MKKLKLLGVVSIMVSPITGYAETSFYTALKMAMDNSEYMQMAEKNRDLGYLATEKVIASQHPSVSVSADATNRFSGKIENKDTATSLAISAQWQAYQFGRKKLARQNAKLDVLNTDLDFYNAKAQTITKIVSAYFSLIEIRKQFAIQSKSLNIAKNAVDRDLIAFKGGTLSESAYLTSKAKYNRIKAQLAGYEIQLANEEAEFKYLVGFDAPKVLSIPNLAKIDLPATQKLAIEQALQNNADLRKTENIVAKLKNTLESQELEENGSISVSASIQKNLKGGERTNNTVNIQYTVPIDMSGVHRNKVNRTSMNLTANKIQYRLKKRGTATTVKKHWQSYITQKHMLDANLISIKASNSATKVAEIKYKNGQISSAELFKKVEEDIKSTQQYVRGLKQYALAVVNLLTATGNLTLDKFSKL